MTYKLSPSSIGLMLDCPRCFWRHMVENIRRPAGPFPSLPNGIDRILKEHFDRFMERGGFPPELREQDGIDGCSLFNDKEKLRIWRDGRRGGIEYWDEESGVLLRGAVDNILVKGGKLIVLDYKTRGRSPEGDTHEYSRKYYQTQMDLYNLLLRKNGYQTEDYAYLLFYYPNQVTETGEVIFDTELIKMPTDPERGEEVFKKAIKLLQLEEPPMPSPDCAFCRFRGDLSL